MSREHSTEGRVAQALDGRARKARRREDAVPEAQDWAVHLGRYDIYLWDARKMVAVEVEDAAYYLSVHEQARITEHPRARFAWDGTVLSVLRPPVSLADIRKELGVR